LKVVAVDMPLGAWARRRIDATSRIPIDREFLPMIELVCVPRFESIEASPSKRKAE
jgi:hypothetical protein